MKNSLILVAIILVTVTDTTAQDLIERTQQNKAQKTPKTIQKNTSNPNPLAKLVTQSRKKAKTSTAVDVFKFSNNQSTKTTQHAYKSIELALNETAVNKLLREKQAFLSLKVPVSESNYFELELVRNDFQAPAYKVSTSKPTAEPYQNVDMVFYKGIVKNDNRSLASVSIANNQIRILASDTEGNYVVGKMPASNAKYVLYNDVNLRNNPEFSCETPDVSDGDNVNVNTAGSNPVQGECIPIYIEADFAFFQDNGNSVENVEVYLNSLFNEVETIYFNESVEVAISEIFVHTEAGPFVDTDNTTEAITIFQELRQNNFNGRVAHLITGRPFNAGRAADIDVLCTSTDNFAISALYSFYNTFPTYSWDLYVFAHEIGHVFASRHTHACVWNGNNTAIDGCSTFTEGSCAVPGLPTNGGTMMSYCHQNSEIGVNFSLGFGEQPGDLLRNRFNISDCILVCEESCNYAGNPCNFIPNSTFDVNTDTWILNNVNATSEQGICKIDIINEGTNPWDAAMYSAQLCLVKDVNYEVSFDAYATSPRDFNIKMALNEAPWDLYHNELVNLTTSFQNYSFQFTNTFSSTSVARMDLQLGGIGNTAGIYIDNIVVRPQECIGVNICEQVENGDFDDALTNWQFWGMGNPQILASECNLNTISAGVVNSWDAALTYGNLTLDQNNVYNIQFDARANSQRPFQLKVGLGQAPFTNYLWETVDLTTQMETYRYTFTMADPTIANVSIEFQVGESTTPVIVDNVSFVENNCESANYTSTCVENINLEGEPDVNIYQAGQNINSRAIIPEGINVSYFSGDNILLYDGFDVAPKADFNAAIKNCGE